MKDGLSLSEIREQFSAGAGQVNLKSMLCAVTGLDEVFIDSLGIDLEAISLSEHSIKAIAALSTALTEKGVADDAKRGLLADAINILADIVASTQDSDTTNLTEEE